MLDEAGEVIAGAEAGHDSESDERSVRGDAAQPDSVGDGDAFAVGEPGVERVGHEVIVAHARNVRLIGESRRKDDRFDARTLARLARIDPQLLSRCSIAARRPSASDGDPSARWTGAGADVVDQHGARTDEVVRGAVARLQPAQSECREAQATESGTASGAGTVAAAIESLSERIYEYNQQIEDRQESYPQVGAAEQMKGVGTLIALTYMLTLEDPQRFRKSRDVGCYVGLQPGRRNSGQSEPQLHISKEGDPYLRTLLVQGAHHILGPFGADSDLRRWGLKLAERGGKNGKKRAVIATARKLAVLLHRLWVSGEAYEPLRNSRAERCRQQH